MTASAPTLRDVFDRYAANQTSMDFRSFARLAKDCGLLDSVDAGKPLKASAAAVRDLVHHTSEKKRNKNSGMHIGGMENEQSPNNRNVNISININIGVDGKGKPVFDSQEISNLMQGANLPKLVQSTNLPRLSKAISAPAPGSLKLLPTSEVSKTAHSGITTNELTGVFTDAKGGLSETLSYEQFENALTTLSSKVGTPMDRLVARVDCPPSTPMVESLKAPGGRKMKAKARTKQLTPRLAPVEGAIPWLQRRFSSGDIKQRVLNDTASRLGPRWLRLHELFENFNGGGEVMDRGQFARMSVDCGMLNSKCSSADVDIIFAEVALKGAEGAEALPKIPKKKGRKSSCDAKIDLNAQRISFHQFMAALEKCAVKRGESADDLKRQLLTYSTPEPLQDLSRPADRGDGPIYLYRLADDDAEAAGDAAAPRQQRAVPKSVEAPPPPQGKKLKSDSPKSSQELWHALHKRKQPQQQSGGSMRSSM